MWLTDRLANLLSGLGTAKDKTTANAHVLALRQQPELDAAYRQNWIARKAVDIVPFDMLREWRQWQAEPDQVTKIESAEAALGLRTKLLEALIRARKDGGAAILIGDGSTDPTLPLVPAGMKQGGIKYLRVLSRFQAVAGEIERDAFSPWAGRPKFYRVTSASGQQVVHPSRIVPFVGAPILTEYDHQHDGWGDSILQALLDAFDQATSSAAYVSSLLPEAKQDIISVPGLSDILSTPAGSAKLTERFAYANRMKSQFNMLLLEGDGTSAGGETFQQKQISFTGLPDVVRLFLQIASGAADIPVTRFLSQSAAGLNATGEGDADNYRDHIAARQKVDLQPVIAPLDELLIRHALGERPPTVWYNWNPIYQPNDEQKAKVGKTRAETMGMLLDKGLVPEDVAREGVKGWLINDDLFPGIDAAYRDHGPLNGDPAEDEDEFEEPETNVVPLRRATQDAAPRTLYVSRKLKNAADVIAWAKSQGFTTTMPAAELHVTIACSRTPVDWMAITPTWQGEELKVDAGGPRLVEAFGEAIVLLFNSGDLQWRHREIREAGASWDHPEYQPHVTFTYDPGEVDLSKVQPYNGPLVFGAEIFAEVDANWQAKIEAAE